MKNEQALLYLRKNTLLNIDMIVSILRGNADIMKASEKGVLLYNISGDVYMISTDDPETADDMVQSIPHAEQVISHQDFYIPSIQKRFSFDNVFHCHNAVYQSQEPLKIPNKNIVFQPLDESYLGFVKKYYTHVSDEDYIRDRLSSGVMVGAFLGDELTGFMGMHSEGAMGILEILPEFRRQGIARSLVSHYTNMLLAQGYIPYSQIMEGNTASLELNKKMMFDISTPDISWIM